MTEKKSITTIGEGQDLAEELDQLSRNETKEKENTEKFEEILARGEGQGVGGPKQGDGGASDCVCPKCGYKVAHTRGAPCNTQKCPKCGTLLVGE